MLKDGVDYESMDDEPVYLVFMIAAPEGGGNVHLEALARLSTMLMDETFKDALIQAASVEDFMQIIDDKENELHGKKKASAAEGAKTGYRILAVTACPTGIAHTFMAAENLEKKGKELGVPVKVETQGADGAKNVLTTEEIQAAECIIIAADKNVDLARFNGKPVIVTKVADGIHKPQELIEQGISGQVPIYHHSGSASVSSDTGEHENAGRKIYKNLMNGISHMLPFVIGGGILIALAFLFDDYSIDPSNFGKNTPLAAYLKTIGEFAFGMMLPVLSGYIAMSIADRPGLAVGFVAGLVAKAGCTFANPAGGDVNAGFLGALFAGFAAGYLVLGLSFISEGAIPFAAGDPLRVLPSCIVGSAVAGGLSMLFGCTLRAPHGGIFVLPTIGNPLMYALSILIGSVVGCLILAVLKKPLKGEE